MVRATSRTKPMPEADRADARKFIRSAALQIGFDAVGFCHAHLTPKIRDQLTAFIKAGYHGDMGWLAAKAEQRSHPTSLWPEARSVIVVGLNYAPEDNPLQLKEQSSNGAISVYARNRDYHDLIKGRLKHLAQFVVSRFPCNVKVFVDTAPVMEKPLAQSGGLGWQGKHTNLVSKSHGSWLLLGEIYTTLDLEADEAIVEHCGSCSRCIDVCPTDAFPKPINSTQDVAFLISQSNIRARYRLNFAKQLETVYMVAMIALQSVPGTNLPSQLA